MTRRMGSLIFSQVQFYYFNESCLNSRDILEEAKTHHMLSKGTGSGVSITVPVPGRVRVRNNVCSN